MHRILRRINALTICHAALKPLGAHVDVTMLSRALSTHASAAKPQHPLQNNMTASNALKLPESKKRKFDRTISTSSSLGALHEHVVFNENDFDEVVDLDRSPPPERAYSQSEQIQYPKLPPLPPSHNEIAPSSAPAAWSSSPAEHYAPPPKVDTPSPEPSRPSKRRTLPWANTIKSEKQFTPLPRDKPNGSQYPWNKSISAMKDEQKELRKRNTARVSQGKPDQERKLTVANVAETFLSDEQKGVLKAVIDEEKSVFFTGSAGTGKSVLMRAIISKLRYKFKREPERLAITASTGLAACVIEGQTLHSWAGIGLGKEPAPELVKKIKRNQKTRSKWLKTKVLIVDEVSMVDGELFDKLEAVARALRNNGRPFGGIQVVVTGDFFQLPPVPDKNSVAKFAFDAATWNTCIEHTILLTHVFRQKDPAFASMLNEMRLGQLSQASIRAFQQLSRPLQFEDEVEATEL